MRVVPALQTKTDQTRRKSVPLNRFHKTGNGGFVNKFCFKLGDTHKSHMEKIVVQLMFRVTLSVTSSLKNIGIYR